MKFYMEKKDVKRIESAIRAMCTKGNKYLSALSSIAFTTDNRATITNLMVRTEIKNLTYRTEVPFLLPFEDFKRISKLKNGAEINVISEEFLSIDCAGVIWNSTPSKFEDFPVLPEFEDKEIFSTELTDKHMKAISEATNFVSNEDTRRVMHGVTIDDKYIVGTTGSHLYCHEHGIAGIPETYVDNYGQKQYGTIINVDGGQEKFYRLFENTGCKWSLKRSKEKHKLINVFTSDDDYTVYIGSFDEACFMNYRQLFDEGQWTSFRVPADFYESGKKLFEVYDKITFDHENMGNVRGASEGDNRMGFPKKSFLTCFKPGYLDGRYGITDTPKVKYAYYCLTSEDGRSRILVTTSPIRKQVVL